MHLLALFLSALTVLAAAPASASPEGQMMLAATESLAARWFDPAEAEGIMDEDEKLQCGAGPGRSEGPNHQTLVVSAHARLIVG